MKRLTVNKKDVDEEIKRLTRNMGRVNWFVNIEIKPHKDPEKVYLIIG